MAQPERVQRRHLVLVVDDHELNRDVLGLTLEEDYDVMYASNGQEALDAMREHLDDLSLVLLDIVMPVMDGFEVLERVRNDDQLKAIPIIVLAAEKNAELQALQLGAVDFIMKPFDMHEVILARVGRMIELNEGRKLIEAAEYDTLTHLYSRNFFREYVRRIARYRKGKFMDAVVINIEQFHTINALNGYEFGDEVLRAMGKQIRDFLETTDGIAARTEADNFELYCTPQDSYRVFLRGLQQRMDMAFAGINIHLRMGVSPWASETDPMVMFDRAHAACNKARGNYQDPLVVYDEAMRERELLNQRLLNDLGTAIDEHQFTVFYQPKYDIQCNPPKLASAEALVRWQHPHMGMISPGDFIPLFEGNGLISMVDYFVWTEAAAQVAEWRKKYDFTLPVSVNLSRADMFDPLLEIKIAQLVYDNELKNADLKLEVTESAYTDNTSMMLELIARFRAQGFQVEMDDFGSGYSSLNMLSDMPVDVLKMDMKLVRNIEKNETDRRLVSLIIDLARYLGVTVVAEGVETEGQLEFLRQHGCDLVQGYYFSRPLPANEFEELIKKELATERN